MEKLLQRLVAETQIYQPPPVVAPEPAGLETLVRSLGLGLGGGGGAGVDTRISNKVRPHDPGDIVTRNSSMSPVVAPQSVPSRVSVVLVEETGVRCAERLASSVPVDEDVRLLAGVACPAGVTVCEDCVVMPDTVGTLSPSDSDYVGPVGPVGTLSPSDSVGHDGPDETLSSSDPAGILFPAVPAGIPFSVGPVGPVGPDGMLSSSDLAGILFPTVPAGIPFPAGPVGPVGPNGMLFSSRSCRNAVSGRSCWDAVPSRPLLALMGRCPHPTLMEYCFSAVPAGILFPAGPVWTLSRLIVTVLALSGRCPYLIMWEYCLCPFLLVSRLQWTLIVTPLGGWFRRSGRNFRTEKTRLLHNCLPNCLSGTLGMLWMWT